jgi:PAS domain S-box-containing protein
MRLNSYIGLLKENKAAIMHLWISNEGVTKILKHYKIKKEFFIKRFAFEIFDYYISILEEKNSIGDCPAIDDLLEYLSGKNIGLDELFVICAGFKNALIEFVYNQDIHSYELQKEIIFIYEKNFESVAKKYTRSLIEVSNRLAVSDHLINENIIMSTTDIDGIITSVSDAFCEISGYTKEELIGRSHSIIRHPDTSKELFDDLWETIKSGKIWYGEIKNLSKEGRSYWVEATISPEYDKSGKIIGYSAIRHDITYKKESQTQQDIIIEQSKATAMGEMISMIAHQWRQPLQAIAILIQKLPLEKLIDGNISDETLNTVVDSVEKKLSYMSKTIEDFRSFFNPNKEKETIYASEFVEKIRDMMAYSFKVDNINFTIKYENDLKIDIHINEITQVFLNIINNAKEAFDQKNMEIKNINLEFYQQNDNIVFEIADNAGGIPNGIIKKIFEPYFSTKKNKNGTGLGLYMSKTIIEKTGHGILSVSNTENGACFRIVLPVK